MRIELNSKISMEPEEFKKRKRAFAIRVVRLVGSLPNWGTASIMGRQLLRCGTSVGANYRAACRARSRADFVAKMGIVEEECDESLYWMDLLIESGLVPAARLEDLMGEADEILSMVVASIRTARDRKDSEVPKGKSAIRNPQSAIGSMAADVT